MSFGWIQTFWNEIQNKNDVQVLILSILTVIIWRVTLYIAKIQRITKRELREIDIERLRSLLCPLQTLITHFIHTNSEKIRDESLALITINRWLASDELDLLLDQWISFSNHELSTKLQRRIAFEIKLHRDRLQISRNDYRSSNRSFSEVLDGIGLFYHSFVISIFGTAFLLLVTTALSYHEWMLLLLLVGVLALIEVIVLIVYFRRERTIEKKTLINSLKEEKVHVIGE